MIREKDMVFGFVLLIFTAELAVFLLLKPFTPETRDAILSALTVAALALCLVLSYRTYRLYGSSEEASFWQKIILMLVILTLGAFSAFFVSFRLYTIFVALAFFVVAWAVWGKLKAAGVKPRASDHAIAGGTVLLIILIIGLNMRYFRGQAPEDFDMGKYAIEWIVIIMSLALTYLMVIMGRFMGGYISKGWYFMAVGAAIFCLSYTFQTVLVSLGYSLIAHPIEFLDVAALNAVSFSAYYQRKNHLALISD